MIREPLKKTQSVLPLPRPNLPLWSPENFLKLHKRTSQRSDPAPCPSWGRLRSAEWVFHGHTIAQFCPVVCVYPGL